MIIKEISNINKDIDQRERNRPLRKVLPLLLIISYLWLGFYENYATINAEIVDYARIGMVEFDMQTMFLIGIVAYSLIDYLWFEIVFYFYKIIVSMSVFTHTIPRALFENRARSTMVIRNLIIGCFYGLLIMFPYLYNIILVGTVLIDFIMFGLFFKTVTMETVDVMIAPNVLKTLFNGFAFIELIHIITLVLGVL